jgi:hypothetical protein
MSSTRFVPPLDLNLSASFHYYLLTLGAHFSVFLTALLYLNDRPVTGVAVVLLVLLSLYKSLVMQPRMTGLSWRQQSGWRVVSDSYDISALALLDSSRFNSLFCALYFRTKTGRRIDVLVFADSVGISSYKELLVLLRSGTGINDSAGTP